MKKITWIIALVIALGAFNLNAAINLYQLDENIDLNIPRADIISQLGQPDDIVDNEVFGMKFELYAIIDTSVVQSIFIGYDTSLEDSPVCIMGIIFTEDVPYEGYVENIKSESLSIDIILDTDIAFIYREYNELYETNEYNVVEKSESGVLTYTTLEKQFFQAFPELREE